MEQAKHAGDVASAVVVGSTLVGWLPSIAALFTIIWTLMRIVTEWDAFCAKVRSWFGGGGA